jgi:DNA-directed RNA polymerase specialized sigma24 family protein
MAGGDERLARIELLLSGILALLAAERDEAEGDGSPKRTEAVLADAGLGVADIAALLGKNRETVKSAVRRSKQPSAKKRS